jgi:deazaflavin-dependent oxidoreductase (nitroreductase family)
VSDGCGWPRMTRKPPQWYTRSMRSLGHHRWFAIMTKRVGWRLDRMLLRLTSGRFDLSGPDIPTMLLTTTGCRTGLPRTVPLAYVEDGHNVVVVCENFGLSETSRWPQNVLANPAVVTRIGDRTEHRFARLATSDEEDLNMPRLLAAWPAHDTYLERTGHRQIFVLEPSNESPRPVRD